MAYTEDSIKADARRAEKCQDIIESELNPREFEMAVQTLSLRENKATKLLHEQFQIEEEVYNSIWPPEERLPIEWRCTAAQEIRRPIRTDLIAVLAIPRKLLHSKSPVAIRVILRFHGGGGTCGEPLFDPWSYKSSIDYTLENDDVIILEFSYRLWPDCSPEDTLDDIANMWKWTFDRLETKLRSININFSVDWTWFIGFGVSYGGEVSLKALCVGLFHDDKPEGFRIRSVITHAPTSMGYSRKHGEYMGTDISPERAEGIRKRISQVQADRPYPIPSSNPNALKNLFGGPVRSIGVPPDLLEETSAFRLLKKNLKECCNKHTRFLFYHGDEDKHVKLEDTISTVEMLQSMGYYVKLIIQQGKAHAWDVDESLSEDERDFLNAS